MCCRKSQLRVRPKCQGLADQLLLWAYTGVFQFLNANMSGAEQVNSSPDNFKGFGRPTVAVSTYTHVLQKKSNEGWPTTCCCEHTRVCVLQINPMKKSSAGSEHPLTLADQLLLRTHTCVCCRRSQLRVAPKGQGLADQLLLRAHTACVCVPEQTHVWCRTSQLKLGSF